MSDSKKAAAEMEEEREVKTAAEKKEEKKSKELQVIVEDDKLLVSENDKFIEGYAEMLYEEICFLEDMQMPNKTTLNNKNDNITIYNDEKKKTNTKTNLYILEHTLTDWSSDKDITYDNLRKIRGFGKLFREYINEIKKINGLIKDKDKEEEEKKPE